MLRVAPVVLAALGSVTAVHGQAIEPRLYSNAPVGVNFFLGGYARSSGDVVLDPSIPLDDASIDIDLPFAAYVRSIGIAGRSGKVQVLVPYAWLSGEARFAPTGQVLSRNVHGFGDPSVRLAVNLHGAPALSPEQFREYHQDLIVGVSLQISAPLGQYDPGRLVNLGTNRWSFIPQLGLSQALGRWTLEGTLGASFYTTNDDFYGGVRREQDPIYAAQGHVIVNFKRGIWSALDVTYYTGGRTTLDGVEGNDLQRNWRAGLTLALPVNRRNSVKLYVSEGVQTRAGGDFVTAGAAWQYRWGAGL